MEGRTGKYLGKCLFSPWKLRYNADRGRVLFDITEGGLSKSTDS